MADLPRRFIYDERKRRDNIRKHQIDFRDVERVFDGPSIDDLDYGHSQHEERWRRLVWIRGRVVVVIYTERSDAVRLISAFAADSEAVRLYYERFFTDPTT